MAEITEPGLYDLTAEAYHADPCAAPSLSSTIARLLVTHSPEHARFAHPRLNPSYSPAERDQFDLGTAAHALILEGQAACVIVDAPDWKTKAAQTARAAARVEGQIALLSRQWESVQAMVDAARSQLARHPAPVPLADGTPERTLIWLEQDIWCRARPDWLHHDRRTLDDYKTTSGAANPEQWTRSLFAIGYDVQAAFYLRGLRAVCGIERAAFRFVVQETTAPYALAVIGLAPEALALAEQKVEWAITQWSECLNANRWPGYPSQTCWAQLPTWIESQWLERKYRDEQPARVGAVVDDGRPLDEQLFGDQP